MYYYFNLVVAEPQIQGDSIIGTHVEFQCQLSNIDRLELVLENDTLVGISTLIASTKLESITLSTFDKIIDASLHSYRIMGYRNKKRVLVTKRLIRYVPANENYLSLEQGTSTVWDFAFNGYTGLYTRFNQIGWSRNGNAVVLDNGQTFSKSADTTLSFFLNVPAADNPAPGCVQNYKFWRDNNEEESWSSIDKIFFNTTIEMVYILDDETLIGVYYDLAREWLATWLNRANGSPASETVVQAFVNCKEILQENQHDALNFRLGEHKDGSDSNQILSTLYAYNNGNDVKINGDPLACTLNTAFYIRAEYDTRKSIDVLRIVVKANGKDKKELKSVSGAGIIDETFYLDGFADERIEIDIRFTSEHGQVSSGRGIIIRRVVFSA